MALFDEQLQKLQEDIARKRKLQKQLEDLERQRRILSQRADMLSQVWDREQSDVDKLECRSLTRLFLRITGMLEETLSKEEKEAAEAAFLYNSVVAELKSMDETISGIKRELNGRLYNVEMVYEQTLRKKKEAVAASNDPRAQRIVELEEQLGQLKVQNKELDEAIFAGERALRIAGSIRSSLESAENWGTWDLIGGGGLITHMVKHNHLDEAQGQVESLQAALGRFRMELADVKISADLTVNIEGFTRFADYFFDGLFADWAVLERIQNSTTRVYEVQRKLEDAIRKLKQMQTQLERNQRVLKAEQEELLSNIPM